MKTPYLMAAVLLAPMAAGHAVRAADEAAPRPVNIVLILADDLGYGDLGCYGHPRFKTPHLDRLAQQGARWTNFYAPMPYCAPTRGALLTGRHPLRTGFWQNPFPAGDPQVKNLDHVGLDLREKTVADRLRAAGYRTACFGKWHLGHQPQFRPLRRGFDEYAGILYSNDMPPVELFAGDERIEYPVVQATLTRRLTDRALQFLHETRQQDESRPFFLYFPQPMVHKPLAASEAFYRRSGAGLYGDALAELDASVGEILGWLERNRLADDTLVLFTSDNGPWYGGSTGGLRGMKGMSWEGGYRVPLLVRWPGRIPPGIVVDEPAVMMDLAATILAAARVEAEPGAPLDGRDLRDRMQPSGTASREALHEAIFLCRGETLAAVRSGPWKLHLAAPQGPNFRVLRPDEPWTDPRGPDGVTILAPYEQAHPSQFPGLSAGDPAPPGALFHLAEDPGEQHNVAGAHPEVVARLRTLAEAFQQSLRKP